MVDDTTLKEAACSMLRLAQQLNPGSSLETQQWIALSALRALHPGGLTFEGERRLKAALVEAMSVEACHG